MAARIIIAALCATAAACRSVPPRFGPDLPSARATAADVIGGIATRFDRVFREPKVRAARRGITRNLLTPSRLMRDTVIWSVVPNPNTRIAGFRGLAEPSRYHFLSEGWRNALEHPGDSRHEFRLVKRGEDQFEWIEDADYSLGNTNPVAMASVTQAWIASGERSDSAALRAEVHAAFPRSTQEWGKLFSIASMSSQRDGTGAWTQRHTIALRTDRAKKDYPAFAKFMHDYVGPLRLHLRLHDSTSTWFDVNVRDEMLVLRMRSRGGRLLPLEGGDRAFPDTMTLSADVSAKFSLFRIGFKSLHAQFVSIHTPSARGWSMRFTREPDWELPLLAEQMLRSPLRYPFSGGGTVFRIAAQREAGSSQTSLNRRIILPVQESAILRFVSKLVQGGVSDYIEGADRDMNLFMFNAFSALRDDVSAQFAQNETPPR